MPHHVHCQGVRQGDIDPLRKLVEPKRGSGSEFVWQTCQARQCKDSSRFFTRPAAYHIAAVCFLSSGESSSWSRLNPFRLSPATILAFYQRGLDDLARHATKPANQALFNYSPDHHERVYRGKGLCNVCDHKQASGRSTLRRPLT